MCLCVSWPLRAETLGGQGVQYSAPSTWFPGAGQQMFVKSFCVCRMVYAHMCGCVEANAGRHRVFCSFTLCLIVLSPGSFTERGARPVHPSSPCLYRFTSCGGVSGMCLAMLSFTVGARDLNSRPQACETNVRNCWILYPALLASFTDSIGQVLSSGAYTHTCMYTYLLGGTDCLVGSTVGGGGLPGGIDCSSWQEGTEETSPVRVT